MYCQGDIVQSDPNTRCIVTSALSRLDCLVVQDIFPNETAKYAHVFLPGQQLLEKTASLPMPSGASTRAQDHDAAGPIRRLGSGKKLAQALAPMNYAHLSEIMDENWCA